MPERTGGFLVDSTEECAQKVLRLLQNPKEGKVLGNKGKEILRERFLLTRLIADELKLHSSLMQLPLQATEQTITEKDSNGVSDPVCGTLVLPEKAISKYYKRQEYNFCSNTCRKIFEDNPKSFIIFILFVIAYHCSIFMGS